MIAMIEGEGGGDMNSFIKQIYKEMDRKSVEARQIVEDLIIFAVKDGKYDARLRVILVKLANFIGISLEYVELSELSLVEMLSTEINSENDEETKRRNQNKKIKRFALIALASIGGGAILGNNIHQL